MVRVSTVDETAIAGLDYKPKTEMIEFAPGISALDFEIEIFPDSIKENMEYFRVLLGPQDPVSGVFGRHKQAKVYIRDKTLLKPQNKTTIFDSSNNNQNNINSKILSNKNLPYLNSLQDFIDNKNKSERVKDYAPNGKPLICLEPCDPSNPAYSVNKQFCENLAKHNSRNYDYQLIRVFYSWEISTPNEFNQYSSYVKLNENSFFSIVNDSVLESIYFQPKFRIRCAVRYELNDNEEILTLKSNYIQIHDNNNNEESSAKCLSIWQEKTSDSSLVSLNENDKTSISYFYAQDNSNNNYNQIGPILNSLPLMSYLKFNRPFLARADYVSAEFITNNPALVDVEYLNYIRLSIEIPYVDGFVPLISTQPLHNYRYLLNYENDDENVSPTSQFNDHLCSNFVDSKRLKSTASQSRIKYGFVKSQDEKDKDNGAWTIFNKYRSHRTLQFYSHLDKSKCVWKFVAYYDISELTTHCQAQIMSSDSDIKDFNELNSPLKSHLAIKIPLYVSYLYASNVQPTAWSSINYKTNVEASIIYKTKSFQSMYDNDLFDTSMFFEQKQQKTGSNQNKNYAYHTKDSYNDLSNDGLNENLVSLTVSKISLIDNGKLSIDFSTMPSFHGQFIKQHHLMNSIKSKVVSADEPNIEFILDLVWSQYTYDYPEQTWRAVSKTILNVIYN